MAQTQACPEHQEQWKKHLEKHNRYTYTGIRRVLRRPNENLPWAPPITENVQPHDEPDTERQRNNYFTAPRFYCVETVCTPCGVVIAWAKFAKSESPTNISIPNRRIQTSIYLHRQSMSFAPYQYCQWILGCCLEENNSIYC